MTAFSGDFDPSPMIEGKIIDAAVVSFGIVHEKTADPSIVQYPAADEWVFPLWRAEYARSTADVTAGKTVMDCRKLRAGQQLTLIASGVIAKQAYFVLDSNGRVKAATTNATPIATRVIGRAHEASAADGDQFLGEIVLGEVTI